MSNFDDMFDEQSGILASEMGAGSSVGYLPPNASIEGLVTIADCIVSDEQTKRRTNSMGELEVIKLRHFQYPDEPGYAVVVGGQFTFETRNYFVEQAEASTGEWIHVTAVYVGRLEMTNDIIKAE